MFPLDEIPDHVKALVLNARSVAIWPIDVNPLSEPYLIASYFQDKGFKLFPLHDTEDRILEEPVVRDIRLIPDDYDILLIFCQPDQLPETVNAIFIADYIPPLIWTHTGIHDLFSLERLTDAGITTVMSRNIMECHRKWTSI